jgi:hypothetical protein
LAGLAVPLVAKKPGLGTAGRDLKPKAEAVTISAWRGELGHLDCGKLIRLSHMGF